MITRIFLIYLFISSFFLLANGQYSISNLSISDNTDTWFQQQIGIQNTDLITGSYYKLTISSRDSHPFFSDRNWAIGNIKYRGQVFLEVPLHYHIEEDIVLTKDPTDITKSNQPILLNDDEIEWFEISGHFFRKYTGSSDDNSPSFYDIIFEGNNLSLLAKRKSYLKVVNGKVEYVSDDKYFLCTSSSDIVIGNGAKWIRSLKEYKNDLRAYVSRNNIRKFKNTDYQSLKELAKYSEKLVAGKK